jgi:hypothetical protein
VLAVFIVPLLYLMVRKLFPAPIRYHGEAHHD